MVAFSKPSISDFCPDQIEGWGRVPFDLLPYPESERNYVCCFLRSDGIQFTASIENNLLHVTVAPLHSLVNRSEEEWSKFIAHTMTEILSFFNNVEFEKQPDDPRFPLHKHYFGII
jgi:hypothetical protein